jgi:AmiR/NasT family two-component response regulator
MEEAPENGKELSNSAHANGMNIVTAAISMSRFRYRFQNFYPDFVVLYLKHEGVHFLSQFLICQHYAIM